MKTRFLAVAVLLCVLFVGQIFGAVEDEFLLSDRSVDPHSDPAECALAIQRAVDAAEFFSDREGRAIVRLIGDGGNKVTHPLDRPILLPANISIIGVDNPVIEPPPSIRLNNGDVRHQSVFRFNDSVRRVSDARFRDFRFDLSADRSALRDGDIEDSGSIFLVDRPFNSFRVQNVGTFVAPLQPPILIGNTRRFIDVRNDLRSTNLLIFDCRVDRVRRFVYLSGSAPVSGVTIVNNDVRDVGHSMVQFEGRNDDIVISGNIFRRHAIIDGNEPGHMISTSFDGPVRGLRIRDNQITGIPNAAFERTVDANGVRGAATNGGSADLVAIRNAIDFQITGNHVWYSGELGISILDGSRFGLISQNDIRYCDGTGLIVGSAAFLNGQRQRPVDHITVSDNAFIQNGQDEAGDQRQSPPSYNTLAQIRIWNAEQVEVLGNRIDRTPIPGSPASNRNRLAPRLLFRELSGIWLFDNSLRGDVDGRVIDFFGCGNVFTGYNLRVGGRIQDFSYVQGAGLRVLPEEASRVRLDLPGNENSGWTGMIQDRRCAGNQFWRAP